MMSKQFGGSTAVQKDGNWGVAGRDFAMGQRELAIGVSGAPAFLGGAVVIP